MFQYYEITLEGNDKVVLTYKLERHRPAQVWAGMINATAISSLRPTLFPWQDFDRSVMPLRIKKLESLIDVMNLWLPDQNKIQGKWNHADHQESVNRLHVHFPEQEKTETDPVRRAQLSEYNDLIHEIETLAVRSTDPKPRLLICPEGPGNVPLEDSDYKLFRARRFFGELCLHYCHVGRHPFELYAAADFDCPVDQILPQYEISSYHTLRFYDDDYLEHWHRSRFYQFYQRSTLRNVMAKDDPRMAFGYITMGNLITEKSREEILNSVNGCDRITHWRTY